MCRDRTQRVARAWPGLAVTPIRATVKTPVTMAATCGFLLERAKGIEPS
jgi:hypothetical protein